MRALALSGWFPGAEYERVPGGDGRRMDGAMSRVNTLPHVRDPRSSPVE